MTSYQTLIAHFEQCLTTRKVPTMISVDSIEESLRAEIPPNMHAYLPEFAQLLADAVNKEKNLSEVEEYISSKPSLVLLFRELAGCETTAEKTLIKFDQGSEVGTVSIQNMAGKDVFNIRINLNINISTPSVLLHPSELRYRKILIESMKNYYVINRLRNILLLMTIQEIFCVKIKRMNSMVEGSYGYSKDWKEDRLLPDKLNVLDVFDSMSHPTLLVLGEPGSGKTLALYEIAKKKIADAEQDTNQPIPILLNLSTWTTGKSITDWIIETLRRDKHPYNKKQVHRWLESSMLLLLLDGLDEVAPAYQKNCFNAINDFIKLSSGTDIVVCCRTNTYKNLLKECEPMKLSLKYAVLLQPLTPSQVDSYISDHQDLLPGLQEALQSDTSLRSLSQNPLMLSMIVKAYPLLSSKIVGENMDIESRRQQILEEYVRRMFDREDRNQQTPYTREQTISCLKWLAQRMNEHYLTVFSVGMLQPGWLTNKHLQLVYLVLTRVIVGLLIGVSAMFSNGRNVDFWVFITTGIIIGFLDCIRLMYQNKRRLFVYVNDRLSQVMPYFITACLSTFGFYIMSGFSIREALFLGVLFGGLFSMVYGSNKNTLDLRKDLHPLDTLSWSPLEGGYYFLKALLIHMSAAAISTFLATQLVDDNMRLSIIIGLFAGLFILHTRGTVKIYSIKSILIWSLGMVLGMIIGVVSSLIWNFSLPINSSLISSPDPIIITGILASLGVSVVGMLWYGIIDLVGHFIVRFLLYLTGVLPRRFNDFLDYAEYLSIMTKSSGGYQFSNRMLQEYFPNLTNLPGNDKNVT